MKILYNGKKYNEKPKVQKASKETYNVLIK